MSSSDSSKSNSLSSPLHNGSGNGNGVDEVTSKEISVGVMEVSQLQQQGSMMQLNGTALQQQPQSLAMQQQPNIMYPADGRRAWIVVFGSFIAHFTCLGILYSFGIFVTSYQAEFKVDRATVTVAYTVSLATFFLFGIFAGKLSDRYGVRIIFFIGSVIFVLALIATSFSTTLVHIIVCHGFLLGAGTSLCYFPAVSVLPMWFEKRRSLATGFAVLGSGLGSLFYSVVGQDLFDRHGWRATLQGSAAVAAGLLFIAGICLERRLPRVSKAGFFSDRSVFKDRNFQLLLISAFFFQFAFMVPYAHVYAYATGIGISPKDAATATGSFGIGSAIGRVVLSAVGDYVSAVRVMRSSIVIVGIAMFTWPFCPDMPSLVAFAIVYGFFSGGFIASSPVVLADFFGVAQVGGLIGYQNMMMIPGALAGAPLAGYIYEKTGSYVGAAILGGIVLLISSAAMFFLDLSKSQREKNKLAKLQQASSLLATNPKSLT